MKKTLFLSLIFISIQSISAPIESLCGSLDQLEQNQQIELKKEKVDRILVVKDKKIMHLMSKKKILKTYQVAFGSNPQGHKVQDKDGKTPEGIYFVEYKNKESAYHLSLKVSYPNKEDKKRSAELGVNPGGDIFIHGFPNEPWKNSAVKLIHPDYNWTNGCVAVTDEEIDEIFPLIKEGTIIDICPPQLSSYDDWLW